MRERIGRGARLIVALMEGMSAMLRAVSVPKPYNLAIGDRPRWDEISWDVFSAKEQASSS
eukprot:scaffold4745_cov125-Isochrysis_galbana.AAC.13